VISPNNSWIFIERDSLDKELVRHPFAPTPSLEDRQLSPYLITMLSVTKQLRITPEQQLTIKEIEKEIRAAWKGRFEARHPLSQNLCEKMATFVREPESQRGRAAKKKNLTVPN
jgi:hypothetical protein